LTSAVSSKASARRAGRGRLPSEQKGAGSPCFVENLGLLGYGKAWKRQLELVERRKLGQGGDRLLFVEHPHTITLGRNARDDNVLVSHERMIELGLELVETDRGGDVTYHGPGQLVGYPVVDLNLWKRDVVAYLRALEDVLIDALTELGVKAERLDGCTGVWVGGEKIAAMGVHISRWITSHGFALNVAPDMDYFGCIIPCGLTKPVTSIERVLGRTPEMDEVSDAVTRSFGRVFDRRMLPADAEKPYA